MIRAILFDFDEVVAADQTPHLRCFQQALAERGLLLTKDNDYGAYLGMDKRTCAAKLLAAGDNGPEGDALPRIHSHPQACALPRRRRVREARRGAIPMSHCHRKPAGTSRLYAAWDSDRAELRGDCVGRRRRHQQVRSGNLSCDSHTTDRSGAPPATAHRRAMRAGGGFPSRPPRSKGVGDEGPRAGLHLPRGNN